MYLKAKGTPMTTYIPPVGGNKRVVQEVRIRIIAMHTKGHIKRGNLVHDKIINVKK